jgi:hypothetical protein
VSHQCLARKEDFLSTGFKTSLGNIARYHLKIKGHTQPPCLRWPTFSVFFS